jgi:hypothetical protein
MWKKEDVGSIAGMFCTMCGISYMEWKNINIYELRGIL